MPVSDPHPIVLILVLLLIGGGAYVWRTQQAVEAPADELTVYGNVDIREVDLSFNNSERLVQLLVNEGDRVRKGQLLAVLNKARIETGYAAAIGRATELPLAPLPSFVQALSATSTSSSICFASPNSMRLFSL